MRERKEHFRTGKRTHQVANVYRIDRKEPARAMIAGRAHCWHAHACRPAHPRPNHASQATPRCGPEPGRFLPRRRVPSLVSIHALFASRLKAGVGRPSTRNVHAEHRNLSLTNVSTAVASNYRIWYHSIENLLLNLKRFQ
jgi:hypothetical protein